MSVKSWKPRCYKSTLNSQDMLVPLGSLLFQARAHWPLKCMYMITDNHRSPIKRELHAKLLFIYLPDLFSDECARQWMASSHTEPIVKLHAKPNRFTWSKFKIINRRSLIPCVIYLCDEDLLSELTPKYRQPFQNSSQWIGSSNFDTDHLCNVCGHYWLAGP